MKPYHILLIFPFHSGYISVKSINPYFPRRTMSFLKFLGYLFNHLLIFECTLIIKTDGLIDVDRVTFLENFSLKPDFLLFSTSIYHGFAENYCLGENIDFSFGIFA